MIPPRGNVGSETKSFESLGVHRHVGRDDIRHLARLGPVGMTERDVAVREQRVLPVAALRARAKELLLDDVLAVATHEFAQTGDARDAALALRALEDDRDVVLP